MLLLRPKKGKVVYKENARAGPSASTGVASREVNRQSQHKRLSSLSPLLSSPLVSEGLRSPRLCRPPGSHQHPVGTPNRLTVRAPDAQRRAGSLKSGWPRTALGSATAGAEQNEHRRGKVPTPVQPTCRCPSPYGERGKRWKGLQPKPRLHGCIRGHLILSFPKSP